MKYCKVCDAYFPKQSWRYHSTQPSMTHIDNLYRNDMERLYRAAKRRELERIAGGKA